MSKIIYRRENKETKVSENFEQSTVMCNNVPDFIDVILRERLLEDKDSVLIRIGIDGGGGFLKICLSIFDINGPFSNVQSGVSNKFKESGVKKIFLIAIVPNVPENYVNAKKLWINLCLQNLDKRFPVATDLKLCNILLGLMSHSSMNSCCWCDIKKGNLNKNGKQRTISHLMSFFGDSWESRAENKDAKDFGNVIHPPILCDNADNDTPVIALLPRPELHLLIVPVNTMYDGMANVWSASEEWLSACNVKKTDYNGGSFAGNDSRTLLKYVDRLQNLCSNGTVLKFVDAFRNFDEVVSACYGDNLSPDFMEKINKFSKSYMKLKISVTPKIHAVMYHVAEFCSMTGRGLGPWSEQTMYNSQHL